MNINYPLALLLCSLLWAAPLCVQAQQPDKSLVEAENAELRRRVRELELRLEAVEALLKSKSDGKASDAVATLPAEEAKEEDAPPTRSVEPGQPQREENRLLRFFRSTSVNGYLDTYYAYNFNRPFDGINTLRAYDTRHRQFSFNAAGLALERVPDASTRVGYRLDLLFGPAADYLASEEPGGAEVYKHVHQAYGSYLAPLGSGLQLDFGKLIAWSGAESDQVLENWNYSRGLLYTFAQPAYHMGLRATYSFGPKVSLMGAVFNGWDNVEDNNDGKSFGISLTYAPTSRLSLTQNYTVGPEQPEERSRNRHFFDTVLTYDFNSRLSALGNYDYGFDGLPDGTRVRWQGVTAAFRYRPTERLAISPRFEWFRDYEGFTTGTAQRLREATLTGEYRIAEGLLARLEYRRDWSDQPVFATADPSVFRRTQATLASGFVWYFNAGGRDTQEKETLSPAKQATPAVGATSTTRPERYDGPARSKSQSVSASAKFFNPRPIRFRFRVSETVPDPAASVVFTGSLFGGSSKDD